MELGNNDYVLGMWFADDKDGNSLMMIVKRGENLDSWEGEYTFRYKRDDKIFDSNDVKSRYSFKIEKTSDQEVIEKMNLAFDMMSVRFNNFRDFVEVKGDHSKMVELLKDKKWCHIKKQPKDRSED